MVSIRHCKVWDLIWDRLLHFFLQVPYYLHMFLTLFSSILRSVDILLKDRDIRMDLFWCCINRNWELCSMLLRCLLVYHHTGQLHEVWIWYIGFQFLLKVWWYLVEGTNQMNDQLIMLGKNLHLQKYLVLKGPLMSTFSAQQFFFRPLNLRSLFKSF